jgi:hypothetical protein
MWKRAQVDIIRGEIARGSFARSTDLGHLQSWLDDPSNADRNFVLKVKDIFQRAVEAVGPEMRAGCGIDQLSRDAYPPARLPYRAFQGRGAQSGAARARCPVVPKIKFATDSSLEGDGFELPVPGRIYSAAMRSQVISRCSSLSPVRRGGGMRTMRAGVSATAQARNLSLRTLRPPRRH